MSKRKFAASEPELMDRPNASPEQLAVALESLRGLNRYFGAYRIVTHFIERWMQRGENVRVVDLATGSADIPRLIADYARKLGVTAEIVAVDFQPSTIANARKLSAGYPEIVCEQANVLTFSPEEKFDIVICFLALHHFSEDDAVRLLRRCGELSRGFVLVSDLRRGLLATVGVYLLTAIIFRDPMTKSDGRASARRAFSFRELREMAARAGWEKFGAARFSFARQAIWMERARN